MIDEKKIIQATNDELKSVQVDYMDDDGFGVLYPTEQREMDSLIRDVFADGVYWAISQFKKSLWHAKCVIPETDDIIAVSEKGEVYIYKEFLYKTNWKKEFNIRNIERWCYIDDILPKKGGE